MFLQGDMDCIIFAIKKTVMTKKIIYIGESPLKDRPVKSLELRLKDGSVSLDKLSTEVRKQIEGTQVSVIEKEEIEELSDNLLDN